MTWSGVWRASRASGAWRCSSSREDHCLLDLLWRASRGELDADVALVVSNHETSRRAVEAFGVPFLHVPVTPETKPAVRAGDRTRDRRGAVRHGRPRALHADPQRRTCSLGSRVPVINIHHSFLPAFAGADPYRRAMERGVKIIGATAHYVTEELDGGPIIEQDVVRVSHRAGVDELTRMGADIERLVLARAVRWHLEDRVLVDGNKTVVFT